MKKKTLDKIAPIAAVMTFAAGLPSVGKMAFERNANRYREGRAYQQSLTRLLYKKRTEQAYISGMVVLDKK